MVPISFVKPLGRYADILNLLSVFPLLSYLKFGYIIRDRRARLAAASRESEGTEETMVTPDKDDSIPSTLALVLLLFAELCTSFQMFDPRDKLVTRAVGEVGRMKKKTKPGLSSVHDAILKLIENDDVYELARFLSIFSCLTGVTITVALRLYEMDPIESGSGIGGPMKQSLKNASRAARRFLSPRFWSVVLLCSAFIVGNWSLLAKFMRRPIAIELLRALSVLARALSAALVATGSSYDGELPVWCAMQGAAAVARGTYLFGYERVSWSSLLTQDSKRSVCGALALEALCFVQLLPGALRRGRMMVTIAILIAPCIAILMDGHAATVLQPILTTPVVVHRMAMVLLAIGTFGLFLGGFSGMMAVVFVLQALAAIHGLEKLKY